MLDHRVRNVRTRIKRSFCRSDGPERAVEFAFALCGEDLAVCAGDQRIDHLVDSHDTVDELLQDDSFLDDDAVSYVVGEILDQNGSEILHSFGHGDAFTVNEVPTHSRAGQNNDQAEKYDELRPETDKSSRAARVQRG